MVQTKSRHHKNENTFRFQTLNERLSNISVDVTKRINRYNQKPEETETYFYQALEKWVDLNYTAVFYDFTIKIKSKCQTLAMLVYHKESLINTIKEFIIKADTLSLQPILDLTAQLARDLQNDFYVYFPEIFKCITKLLDTQDTEILEWSFQTLSYLFKFLWRYMLKNLSGVYELYSPLFDESRRHYIRNFAAESFAFLMRKVQDKNELFNFLLTQRLIEHPKELNGIGRLIFEMFKGIKHQFNECMKTTFPVLLQKLNFYENDLDKNDLIFECIGKTVESMAQFTKKELCSSAWKCFYSGIDENLNNKKKLTYVLRLVEVFLRGKQCYLIDNLDLFLDNMVKVSKVEIDDTQDSIELTKCFFDIGKLVLLSESIKFSIEKSNVLPNCLYQAKYDYKFVANLTRSLFDFPSFENIILPNLTSFYESQIAFKYQSNKSLETSYLSLLTEYLLVHKKILASGNSLESNDEEKFENFLNSKNLNQINRLFKNDKTYTESLLNKKLTEFIKSQIENYENDHESLIQVLITSPFVLENVLLKELTVKLIKKIDDDIQIGVLEDMTNLEMNCYLLSLTVWSMSLNSTLDSHEKIINLIEKVQKLKNDLKTKEIVTYDFNSLDLSSNHLLQTLKLSFDKKIQPNILEPILNYLKIELSSPYGQNRLNSLHLLQSYFKQNELTVNDEHENLLDICFKTETTPASLDEYRQKIFYLQKLDPVSCNKLLSESLTSEIPLRFLFGVLFENFKLLWNPTVTLIESYASSMKQNDFWNVFGEFLVDLTHKIECKGNGFRKNKSKMDVDVQDCFDLMESLKPLRLGNMASVDYMNNRLLLCKAMQGFSQICEAKTRILIPLFFRFMDNEYYKEENRLLSTSYDDLTKKYTKDRTLTSNEKTAKEKYFNRSLLNKHLCAFLDIFAKFTSPKSWYQEENLRNLYLNLLCHYDSSVQKSSLNCLYTYQYEYMKPYRENLEKLLEGKHFRHELIVFSLDENSGVIHNDHRKQLLPILMRILYGKFNSNETTHTSSRDTKSNKRSTIIQFLSSCAEYELNYFFNLIFDCLNVALLDSNGSDRFDFNDNKFDETERNEFLNTLVKKLNQTGSIFDVKRTIPFKKILGILQSLDIIIKKLAKQMEYFSHRILLMICFVHKYVIKMNEMILDMNKNEKVVDDYHLNLIKVIRQQVSIRFKQFFDTFDHLNFTQYEYYLIFDSFVWPQSSKLGSESIKSVNNLLKIFQLWSERSKYYPLFVLKKSDFDQIDKSILDNQTQGDTALLDTVFNLIDSQKCSRTVIDFVFEMIHNLVSFADFKEDSETSTVKLPFSLTITNELNDELNFGTAILRPFVTSIVNHIEKTVSMNMSKKSLPAKPLKILARISSFASNSQTQCEKIILLLIPYLVKNRLQSEENELNILSSMNYLIRQVKNVTNFIFPLSRLFLVIKNRQSRVELCNVFKSIKDMNPEFETLSQIICDLNSWDPKRLEEPDYMLRLEAFKQINQIVNSWTEGFDINVASVLVYNCFYFINEIEDLAIKESSTHSVKTLITKSSGLTLTKLEKNFFEANFVSSLKLGLRSKNENCRHEYISIFIDFIKHFQESFNFLKDFNQLFDLEDQEKDFFENIKHIQMHRRSRALKRLQKHCSEISSENLLGFMMPLVRSFIDNEAYHKYDYLIEEACNTIGGICYTLEWPKYIKIVEYYLKILPKNILNQKLVIKILVQVLDAFHYDLSLSTAKDYYTEAKQEGDIENVSERKKKLVGSAMANKIHTTVTKSIIPVLFKCLTKRLKSENEHKVNKHEDEDEQILRVPMALAILKLLNNLPRRTLETHLPGLLFKVCDMLKSRAMSVRNTTRECLIKMVETLPDKKYYFNVFKELGNSLLKGYQVHVLCFTNLIVLKNIQSKLTVGDLDQSLGILLNSVSLELFSDTSEEKEVKQIVAKLMEAKTVSSYQSLQVISKFLSQTELLNLLKPFKEQLDFCTSRKVLKKIEEALRYILAGLLENQSLTTDNLMYLVYGLINDTFAAFKDPKDYKQKLKRKFKDEPKPSNFDDDTEKEGQMPESCLLIPTEPQRGGDKPKTQSKTNQHVIIEFALQLMHSLIKQNRLTGSEVDKKMVQMLDPYIPIFVEYLDGKYVRVTIITLRCLGALLKYPLPSIEQNCKQIASKLFNLLRTYSSSSSTGERGDNLELLMVCYKVISNLIRDVQQFNLNDEQLQVLLHYAERNLYDNQKQATSFNLLKSILSRKLSCEELTDVLGKVMKLSIQADGANVRLQSRQTMLQYILDYSLAEKKLLKLLEFYVMQLNYEYENGRESAIEMLATMFGTFPIAKLNEHASLFFLPLAIQLHNDESPKCKKLTWLAIRSLLEKISPEKRDNLFNITITLFKNDDKPLHKRIGALLIKNFVECEKEQFESRLPVVFDLLKKELNYEKFQEALELNTDTVVTEKFFDQYLYNILTLLMKIFSEIPVIKNKKYSDTVNFLYEQIKSFLCYEHLWVRLVSCQLFGLLFSNFTVDELMNDKTSYFNYKVETDYGKFLRLRDLTDEFCNQLKAPILDNDLAEQIVKNLAFVCKILNKFELKNNDEIEDLKHDINIEWLIKKVAKEAKYELVNKPKETLKRTNIFKLFAAMSIELGKEKLKDYIFFIIPLLQRELEIEQNDENLKRLAKEVVDFIKQTVGIEEFSLMYSKANKKRTEYKEDRKRKLAQMAIVDPQLAATKKIRKQQKKKEAKKRKISNAKEKVHGIKKRKVDRKSDV